MGLKDDWVLSAVKGYTHACLQSDSVALCVFWHLHHSAHGTGQVKIQSSSSRYSETGTRDMPKNDCSFAAAQRAPDSGRLAAQFIIRTGQPRGFGNTTVYYGVVWRPR